MTQKTPKVAFAPPGTDPTDQEYPLEGPTVTGCFGKLLQFGVWGMALYGFIMMAQANFGGASASTPIPPTPEPQIVIVSSTPEPTATPTGTWTPDPTATPTQTAIPSETPIPSATLVPAGALATWTPGAWMLTRHAATIEALRPTATYTRTPTPATKG